MSISWQNHQAYDIDLVEVPIAVEIPSFDRETLHDSAPNKYYGGSVFIKGPGRPSPSTFTVPAWYDYVDNYSDDDDDYDDVDGKEEEYTLTTKDDKLSCKVQPFMDPTDDDASGCGPTNATGEVLEPFNELSEGGLAQRDTSTVIGQFEGDRFCEKDFSVLLERISALTREKEEEVFRRQRAETRIAELEASTDKAIQGGKKDNAETIRLESELRDMGKKLSAALKQQSSMIAMRQRQRPSDEVLRRKYQDLEKELEQSKQRCASAEQGIADSKKQYQELTSSHDALKESTAGLRRDLEVAQSKISTLEGQAQDASRELQFALGKITGLEKEVADYEAQLMNSISGEQLELAKAEYDRLEAELNATKGRLAQVESGEAQIISTQDIEVGKNRLADQAKEIHALKQEKDEMKVSKKDQAKELRRLCEEKDKAEKLGKERFDRHLNLQQDLAKEYNKNKEQQSKLLTDIDDKDAQLRAAKGDIARLEHALDTAGLPQDTVLPDPQMCGNAACVKWKSRTEDSFKDKTKRANRLLSDTKEDLSACRKQLEKLEAEKKKLQTENGELTKEVDRNKESSLECEKRLASQHVKSAHEAARDDKDSASSPAQLRRKRSNNDQGEDRPTQKLKTGTP